MINLIILLIATYLVFIYNFTLKIENNKYKHEIKYNGLIWCLLDYWSIKKYKSLDVPKKWVEHKYIKKS
jgi:hypothetical protein